MNIKLWIKKQKLRIAVKWIMECGLLAVKIEHRAGTDYIHCPDGTMRRIGK